MKHSIPNVMAAASKDVVQERSALHHTGLNADMSEDVESFGRKWIKEDFVVRGTCVVFEPEEQTTGCYYSMRRIVSTHIESAENSSVVAIQTLQHQKVQGQLKWHCCMVCVD